MATLGTTNISISGVRTNLGESIYNLSGLCTSSLINKFSKYKPIRDATGSNWPAGSDSHYGLNLVNNSTTNNWQYLTPRGGPTYNEPYRLGDFRGHDNTKAETLPPIRYEGAGPTTLYPSETPYSYNFSPVPVFNDASSVRIRTSDLGINGYYLGIKISGPPGGPWYKTIATTLGTTGDLAISISTEMTDPVTPGYSNHPYVVGSCTWSLFASSSNLTSWTATPPATVYILPEETYGAYTLNGTGTYTVTDWVACTLSGTQDYDHTFTATGGSTDRTVYCSYSGGPPDWTVSDDVSWITTDTLNFEGGSHISSTLVVSGNAIRITAAAVSNVSDVICVHDATDGYTWTMGAESGSITPNLVRSPDGNVTVTSNGRSKVITIAQGTAGNDQISFTYNPNAGGDFPPSGATINYQIKRGATQVYPASGWASAIGQKSNFNNSIGPLTMTEVAQNDIYTVYIKLMP